MRLLASAVLAAYSVLLVAVIGADPWMWPIWILFAVVMAAVVGGVQFLRSQNGDALLPAARWLPPVVAGAAFAIVAVLAAVLETRDPTHIVRTYWLLGIGMAGSVALFLGSYDRSRFRRAD